MTKTTAAKKKPAKRSTKETGKASTETVKVDLYQKITDKIITALDAGVRPWLKPWSAPGGASAGMAIYPRRVTGQRYTGINVVLLWAAAQERGYTNPTWMTYNQARDLGGQVRKGEKSELIVYASKFKKTEKDANGKDVERMIPFLKSYLVFNVEQIDGLPERFYQKPAPAPATPAEEAKRVLERNAAVEKFFAATGAEVRHGGHRAFFSPHLDFIQMPQFDAFRDEESYYATLGHEFVHWTGREDRLNREFGKRFGDEAYAAEELVAELGSAFLCAILGLTPEVREDHASYVASWLKVLKGDKRFIFTAASLAQKAVDHLQEYSGSTIAPSEEEAEEVADAAA
ncbi:antirestriction protein [Caulobacter phage Ccr2]|uniref:ArdC-like antirestriction protein n=5 Tax=Viruses TaxID=10239 RepID=J3U9I4_9CAUD|nr:anti-restriction protein [Caulobacter phage phiCbK]ARB13727.1 antirestriction protein [Caulobacter phage Ccr10]ARB14072.1 antirestriction protein [Caulobacter phage Ccr2]ARB14761.1 antirestriction protein [Caulobacter phage Ccr29]ARB15106.1 antirestriction protein [Caulobacter phage Ccr32]ARB15440.1 antirestriction protein [Caulobacter phage Ccr34]